MIAPADSIETDVAVVGTGVAAMSAAHELAAVRRAVTLVDKDGRPGGRCATQRVSENPGSAWFDYGAPYLTARDPAFYSTVQTDIEAGDLVDWGPAVGVAEADANDWGIRASPDNRQRLIGPRGLNRWLRARLQTLPVDVCCNTRVTAVTPRVGG